MKSVAPSVDIKNFTRRSAPGLPYKSIVGAILPGWDLSLVFVGEARAKKLNLILRAKDYVPNVLSYASGNRSGEVILCLPVARRQAPSYGLSYPHFTAFLLIHGLLHLKGLRHGTTMEKHERSFLKKLVGATLDYGSGTLTHGRKTTHRNGH